MADMAEGLIPPAWGFQARKVKSSSPGDHWPVACHAAHGVSGRYPQRPPHKPAIGLTPWVSRLRSSGFSGAWALRAGCRQAVARWPRHCALDR